MKSLITGGVGFIGLHLVERLLMENHEIVIIDNLSSSEAAKLSEQVKLYRGNIEDESIGSIIEKEQPDYLFHLAAQVSVQRSMEDPYKDCLSNIAGTINVLRFAVEHKVKKIVFASSAAVYGEPSYLPVDELHPKHPLSYYSLSKITAEEYIKLFNKRFGIDYSILRFSNVYGPGQNAEGEAGVISIFIDRLLKNETPVLYGGDQTRDFVYVKDVVDAMYAASKSPGCGTFNVSTNTETSVRELLSLLKANMQSDTVPVIKPARTGDIRNSRLDNSKIITELQWIPKVSLTKGLKFTLIELMKHSRKPLRT